LAATAGLSAVAVGFLGKSATLSQLALAPAAMAAAAAAFVTFYRYVELPLSAWATLAILTQSIVLVSLDAWYGSMPLVDGVALMLAPVASLAALWGVRERRYATALIAVVAVLACCGVPIAHIIETAMEYRDDGYL
jgi:hypothetical protein